MQRPKQKLTENFIEDLQQTIEYIFLNGYAISERAVSYEENDITRRDLLRVLEIKK